jgi:N-glycosylase/DNA lyase
MNKLKLDRPYNFNITLLGGQSFGWDYTDGWYHGFTTERYIKLKQEGGSIYWQTYPEKDDIYWLKDYLAFDEDYGEIIKTFPKDDYLEKAIKNYEGLHILRQPLEDTVIGFLTSATKSIKGIRYSIRLMAEKFGESVIVDGEEKKLFPKLEVINHVEKEDLLDCKVGFRAQYIKNAAAKFIDSDEFLNITNIDERDTELVRRELKSIKGVGDKIADCILVYGMKRDEVTPFDLWGQRFVRQYYGLSEKAKYNDMREWSKEYLGDYAGWAGQYLFEYIRNIDSQKTSKSK